MAKRKSGAGPTGGGRGRALVPDGTKPASEAGLVTMAAMLPAVITDGGTSLTLGADYLAGGRLIRDAAVYRVEGLKSREPGPWLGEADKVAWLDPASGYECIILRQADGGHLGGYVGVPPGHPLHGYDAGVVPEELGIEVHGGLSYAAACEAGPASGRRLRDEARRICHVDVAHPTLAARYADHPRFSDRYATDYRVRHDDAWWFGFRCDHLYDVVPDRVGRADRPERFLQREVGRTYRDEGYVHDQVLNLAAQLRAVADGAPMPEPIGERPPPLGLDPWKNR